MKFKFCERVKITRGFYEGVVGRCYSYFEDEGKYYYSVKIDNIYSVTPDDVNNAIDEADLEPLKE